MKILLYAHNDRKGIKRHVRYALDKACEVYDLVFFLTSLDKADFASAKVRHVQTPKGWTSEQRYIHGMKTLPEVEQNTGLGWMDDSVVYFFPLPRLHKKMEGRSDWWALHMSRWISVHAEKEYIYFDRETGRVVVEYFRNVGLARVAGVDQRTALHGLSDYLMRRGLGFNAIVTPTTTIPVQGDALILNWQGLASSDLPCIDADLCSRRWRHRNFGMALSVPYNDKRLFDHLKVEHLDPTLNLAEVLIEAQR